MVAPKLAAKLAMAGDTPTRDTCASTLSGMAAALERDVKANVSTGLIFW